MTGTPVPTSAPERLSLARVIPQGGSKWAHCFCGPVSLMVSDGGTILRAGAVVHPNGDVSEAGMGLEQRDAEVFPLAAGDAITLGRFLSGPLAASIATDGTRQFAYCGARLSPCQTEALRKLGAAGGYVTLESPARFRSVICPPPAAAALVAGPHLRALADRLRSVGSPPHQRLAILPPRETERFSLTNRASLMAWLRAKKFTIIAPETLKFDELANWMAAAALLILADPEQAGLVSLCARDTKILEIAPEGWLGAHTRWFCQVFGLQWTPFLANAPAYPLLNAIPFGARVPLSYEIPIRALAKTLDALG